MNPVRSHIDDLLSAGIKLIPVAEKSKKALIEWSADLNTEEIISLMTHKDQYAVAMVLGQRSGGLICIDLDTKYNVGFEIGLFKDFQQYFPSIWKKLRIEKTPSGGYHILYRVSGGFKLDKATIKAASRYANEYELESSPKQKEYCFIEIKGDGALSQCYPSPGYTVFQQGEGNFLSIVPELTEEEHSNIVALCFSLNSVIDAEQKKPIPNQKKVEEFYDENPFEHYNRDSDKHSGLLVEYGWSEARRDSTGGGRIYFTRPGKSSKDGVSATYSFRTGLFTIFTASTELEPKSYTASNLRCELECGGDKKALYEILVADGYGVLKKSVEESIIKRRAITGGDLPSNISEEGKIKFEEEKERVKELYRFGIFWEESEKGGIIISQQGVDETMFKMGFRVYRGELVFIKEGTCIVEHVTDQFAFNKLLLYIVESENRRDVYDAYSKHIDKYGKITVRRLEQNCQLPEDLILKSSKNESFKFYKNCYISITSEGIEQRKYEDLRNEEDVEENPYLFKKYILEKWILNRDYNFRDAEQMKKSMFFKFLSLALGDGKVPNANVFKVIGYLAHDYIDDSMNSIVMVTEKNKDITKGGGSGKNVLFNLMNHITSVHVINGRQVELDKNLLQSFNGERILVISDPNKDFDVSFFKDFSSGAASLKKLYKDVVILKRDAMPKPVILTNYSYKVTAGLERRIIDLEFNDYFSNIWGGVRKEFGCMFPGYDSLGDWNEDEWACFDNIVMEGISAFLKDGELKQTILSEVGWKKQFMINNSHMLDFIEDRIDDWCNMHNVGNEYFKKQYSEFCHELQIPQRFWLSTQRINQAIQDYCDRYNIEFNANHIYSENGVSIRGKKFERKSGNFASKKGGEVQEDVPF